MPLEHAIFPAQRVVRTRGHGELTFPEVEQHIRLLAADPAFDPEYGFLMDMAAITSVALTTSQVHEVASTTVFARESRRAIVVSSVLGYGLGRMYATYREAMGHGNVRVFRSLNEACGWLGVDPAALDAPPAVG